MSEVLLNVLDAEQEIHGRIHGSYVNRIVAALSAEPETIAELEAAMHRFMHCDRRLFDGWYRGLCEEPWDAGICFVDLGARLVVSRSSYSVPSAHGSVAYHDGQAATDVHLSYQLSDDWEFSTDVETWKSLARR